MANLLESSQTQASSAPSYYTNYLSDIASKGTTAANNAQYVGAQPLQEQAFTDVQKNVGNYQPTLQQATGALSQAVSSQNPYEAAMPFLSSATQSPAEMAKQYMSPYIESVINNIGDVGQRNIRQNLAPAATAAAVGSGQFGSKRGAEVLGQTMQNAERDILNQQSTALNDAYKNALQTAAQQNQTLGTLGNYAANAESAGQQNLTQAGKALSDTATTTQNLGLGDVNALSTLGGQQQTIAQNKELFPLQNLTTASGLLRGYNVPTTTTTTAQQSPLSLLAAGTTGLAGMFTPQYSSSGTNLGTPWANLATGLSGAGKTLSGWWDSLGTGGNSSSSSGGKTVTSTVQNDDGSVTITYSDGTSETI